jgi:hypothetical protein
MTIELLQSHLAGAPQQPFGRALLTRPKGAYSARVKARPALLPSAVVHRLSSAHSRKPSDVVQSPDPAPLDLGTSATPFPHDTLAAPHQSPHCPSTAPLPELTLSSSIQRLIMSP